MLRYGASSNYSIFKEKIARSCLEKFGDLGRLIELERWYKPPSIDNTMYATDPSVDTDGIQLHLKRKAYEERQKHMITMHNKRASMYAYILSKLSVESIDEIKRHDKFKIFDDQKNPLDLWMAIKVIHMMANGLFLFLIILTTRVLMLTNNLAVLLSYF